jgi:hypothetical protein
LKRSGVAVEAAFVLNSSHPEFGGLSGLWLADHAGATDGALTMIAISDRGVLWQATLRHDDQGRLIGIEDWSVAGIRKRPDEIDLRLDFEAEALADDGDGGLVVGYEGDHRLQRLPLIDLRAVPSRLPLPEGLGGHSNSGIEALTGLPENRLMAIAERVGAPGGVGLSAWLIDGARIDPMIYQPTPGFAPTGADHLGDSVYILERRFSLLGGFESRIRVLPTAGIRPGARLDGRLLAAFRFGDIGENFEAVAAKRAPDGRTLVYLLTDDNFHMLQRTVLLQLSLPARSDAVAGAADATN